MSNITAALTKKVGPMPLGAWLLVGAGGLWIARARSSSDGAGAAAADPIESNGAPVSGNGTIYSGSGAPVVLSPVINVPAPVVNVNVPKAPTPLPAPKPTTTPKPTPKPAPTPRVPVKPKPTTPTKRTHTVVKGDTLWKLAGARWPMLYAKNKDTIEAAARAHGRRNSGNGHWIYPGTVLVML